MLDGATFDVEPNHKSRPYRRLLLPKCQGQLINTALATNERVWIRTRSSRIASVDFVDDMGSGKSPANRFSWNKLLSLGLDLKRLRRPQQSSSFA